MESAKIPMRGKVKDAEAEAILKLLRQEKEFHSRIPTPQIQQRTPLPAIGRSTQQTTNNDITDRTFITEAVEGSRSTSNMDSDKELLSESSFLLTSKTDTNGNFRTAPRNDIHIPSYSWKDERGASSYLTFERQRLKSNAGRTLPPLEMSLGLYGDLPERPSCPKPGSPKLWDD